MGKSKIIFLSLLLSVVCCLRVNGQTPIILTVGGNNPDFQTITDAINSIADNPTSPYVINVRDGIYNESIVFSIAGTSTVNTVTVQSESQDSTAVIISPVTPSDPAVQMGAHNIIQRLSINGSIESNWPLDVKFLNNVITGNINSSGPEDLTFSGNLIIGNLELIGPATVVNNDITGNIELSGFSTIINNHITGSIDAGGATAMNNVVLQDLNLAYGEHSTIIGNQVLGYLDISYASYSTVADNQVSLDSRILFSTNTVVSGNQTIGKLTLVYSDSSVVVGNEFHGNVQLSESPYLSVTENRFYGKLSISHGDYYSISNNSAFQSTDFFDAEFSYLDSSSWVGNAFHGNTDISYCSNGLVCNNKFYKWVHVSSCPESMLKFNNFSIDGSNSSLGIGYDPVTISCNNLPAVFSLINPGQVTLLGNNYASGNPYNDPAPLFINPMYDSDLRSTNPQLIGTGQTDTLVIYDIDSVWRSNPPTVGANEVCISNDTVNIFCGDTVVLGLCALPANGAYAWTPATGLDSTSVQRPKVSTIQSRWYKVHDMVSGFNDSVFVNAVPLIVSPISSLDSLLCGQQTSLVAGYHANATYGWYPQSGLSSTTTQTVMASPEVTTTYYVTAHVPGCDTYMDSVTIDVNPLPTAYVYIDSSSQNFFQFLNGSYCADSYYWEFGDSTFSSDINPEHFFPDTGGVFGITLVACNSFGCDTFQGAISFAPVIGVIENLEKRDSFIIYPNPTNDDVTISFDGQPRKVEIRLFDVLGNCLQSENRMTNEKILIDLPVLPNGQYFLSIFDGELHEAQKLIIYR
ncbi:MAG: T9SS type A sorting domain-containing protein [Flavobacteriales bacterium]|nr:T9SS type A sorting domain-containing protein [Flavobacteriales bacterium]